MKKTLKKSGEKEPHAEYDFAKGERGKYASRYANGTNVILLAPDVAKVFPTAKAVNTSLRALAGILRNRSKVLSHE